MTESEARLRLLDELKVQFEEKNYLQPNFMVLLK